MLPEREIWWRPNAASNSCRPILCLHVSGNVRQWIVSGWETRRTAVDRDREVTGARPHAPAGCSLQLLRKTVDEACNVLDRLSETLKLMRNHNIQGFRVSGCMPCPTWSSILRITLAKLSS